MWMVVFPNGRVGGRDLYFSTQNGIVDSIEHATLFPKKEQARKWLRTMIPPTNHMPPVVKRVTTTSFKEISEL